MGDRVVTAYVDRPTAAAYYLASVPVTHRSGVQPVARRSTLTQVRNGRQRSARAR